MGKSLNHESTKKLLKSHLQGCISEIEAMHREHWFVTYSWSEKLTRAAVSACQLIIDFLTYSTSQTIVEQIESLFTLNLMKTWLIGFKTSFLLQMGFKKFHQAFVCKRWANLCRFLIDCQAWEMHLQNGENNCKYYLREFCVPQMVEFVYFVMVRWCHYANFLLVQFSSSSQQQFRYSTNRVQINQ